MSGGGADLFGRSVGRDGSAPRRVRRRAGCRGTTTILALLYLVLFSAVALGFYAQTNLGAQVSYNEERVQVAQVAAESGLQFVRYQLSRVTVANTVPRDQILDEVYNQLSTAMDGTTNLGTSNVGFPPPPAPRAINIPANANEFIKLTPDGAQFHATITEVGGGVLQVKTVGRTSAGGTAISRSIAMQFVEVPRRSPVLDYGVATRGTVDLSKSFVRGTPDAARGSILSTDTSTSTPVTLSGWTAEVAGEVYLSHLTGTVPGDGSIAGVSDPADRAAHVHASTPAPEFPTADPTNFISYLVGKETLITGSTSAPYLSNIRIVAGANPTLSGGTYEGVILIEAPNQVTFSGESTIRGVIVVANPTETTSTNSITFGAAATVSGPETLPDNFGELKTMTGSVILAPEFTLNLSGGSSSFGGSALAKTAVLSGGSGGTVNGTFVLTGSTPLLMTDGSTITVSGAPANLIPAGFRFTHTYAPYPATYLEVAP